MLLDQVALEMAKVLLPQMGEGYRTYEELMQDAFTAARCFIGTARQQPVESPENSPASPVQHAQPAICAHFKAGSHCVYWPSLRCLNDEPCVASPRKQQAGAQ